MSEEHKDDIKEDVKEFALNNKFQWFMIIVALIILLRVFGLLPEVDFVTLFKYSIFSVFGAEGLDQLTNIRKG